MAAFVLAPPAHVTSVAGVLSLLEEQENQLRVVALNRLDAVVDHFWHEIADYLTDIESLYEDPSFPDAGRELAALVASKVFYHLEAYGDSLRLALGAGNSFDVSTRSEYVEKIVAVAIDEYIKLQQHNFEAELKKKHPKEIDPRLEDVVNRMFARCSGDKAYKQGLGMALECRRLDMVRTFITASQDKSVLEYCQASAMPHISSKAFREQVVRVLVEIYKTHNESGIRHIAAALCQCYFILGDHNNIAEILNQLVFSGDRLDQLMAYQIGFDVVDNENQAFCDSLLTNPRLDIKDMGEDGQAKADPHLTQLRKILSGRSSIDIHLKFLYRQNRSDLLLLETIKNSIDIKNAITHNGTVIAHGLMQCGTTSDVFLRKNLEWLAKATNWAKFSATASLGVIHKGHIKESRAILSTYLPQGGGGRGSPYSEGGALYAMGLIHANHFDPETNKFMMDKLDEAQSSEVLQHGACLGIGLLCMATGKDDPGDANSPYEKLKQTLYTDTAVAGEAAAYAIGLVMVGSASERAIGELLAYAHDTQHEKIIRGCSLALAMIVFRKEEEAETLISQMLLDKDAILRYGGCFAIALAYVGTSQNEAIRRLLHISVSDVSDDVRRAAVMALGFVMCNVPDQLPGVVKLLCESYNPHVRYAAAMALGIACAGSALPEAHSLLQPLMSDSTDFVRGGAFIALGLLYMQTAPGATERVKEFRAKLLKVIGDKHEDIMTRFGAIIANGVMDAGGRNSCASLFSTSGVLRCGAAIGFCLFTQMWYWFPLIHMFSLTLTPTAFIGLNDELTIPKTSFIKSGARPSLFAYPEPMQPPKKEEQGKAALAVLSTAAKAKALKEKKEKEKELTKMEVDEVEVRSVAAQSTPSMAATQGTTVVGSAADSLAPSDLGSEGMGADGASEATPKDVSAKEADEGQAATDGKAEGKKESAEPEAGAKGKEEEPTEEILQNPCRVLPAQKKHISFLPTTSDGQEQRYRPLVSKPCGICMLIDGRPGEPEDIFFADEAAAPQQDDEEKEPDPPEPFEYTDDQ